MAEALHNSTAEGYPCDICGITLAAPTALGMHKRMKHGIMGASKAALAYRKAQASTGHKVASATEKIKLGRPTGSKNKITNSTATAKRSKAIILHQKEQDKGVALHGEAITLITVGKITQICQDIAIQHSIPTQSFTRRVSELFFASQLGQE